MTSPANPTHLPERTASRLTRRWFLQWSAGTVLALGGTFGYVRTMEPRWLNVDEVTLPIQGLSPALDGRRLAQLSDIHLSQYLGPEHLAQAMAQVRDLQPDWLVMTGDFVGDEEESAAGLVEPLQSLDLPKFAVVGNHDYWTDVTTVQGYLRDGGATVLVNEAAQAAAGLWFAGMDDLWSGRPDLRSALQGIPSSSSAGGPQRTVLLAHEPDFFDRVVQEDAPVAVQLSGHSHGGQVRLPTFERDPAGFYSYAPILPRYGRRYPIGLRKVGERFIYTNRGLGVWPVPYRLNCRPELTVFTLRAA